MDAATEDNKLATYTATTTAVVNQMDPKGLVVNATAVANELKPIIREQELFTRFGDNEHVDVEGWQLLICMMGYIPEEDYVKELSDGFYEAKINLVNRRDGTKINGFSAICGPDEPNWKNKPRHARRSMALTRAVSKTGRQCFSWVMSLAGYHTTPAEEMPDYTNKGAPKHEVSDNLYVASKSQKEDLMKIFTNLEVTDTNVMDELSKQFRGKVRLNDLREAVEDALATRRSLKC